jgi:radical SAM/Cys-rich protein
VGAAGRFRFGAVVPAAGEGCQLCTAASTGRAKPARLYLKSHTRICPRHRRWMLGTHWIDGAPADTEQIDLAGLPEFLAAHGVEVVASLPCYLKDNVDLQRGIGVFAASIRGLQQLNALGYGSEGSGLVLNLVYNPLGPSLPPAQAGLEAGYKRELSDRYGIRFNRLYTLANMPIRRFAHRLRRDGDYETYMALLANAFNPATVDGLMCRDTVSVGWDGRLYDCDFNQMLGLPLGAPRGHVRDLTPESLSGQPIAQGGHCFGCTAGAGSGCGGALAEAAGAELLV